MTNLPGPPIPNTLLPCPFCKGKASVESLHNKGGYKAAQGKEELECWLIGCGNSSCYLSLRSAVFAKIEVAIALWNTRVHTTPDPLAAVMEALEPCMTVCLPTGGVAKPTEKQLRSAAQKAIAAAHRTPDSSPIQTDAICIHPAEDVNKPTGLPKDSAVYCLQHALDQASNTSTARDAKAVYNYLRMAGVNLVRDTSPIAARESTVLGGTAPQSADASADGSEVPGSAVGTMDSPPANFLAGLIACDVLIRNMLHRDARWYDDPTLRAVLAENTRLIQAASGLGRAPDSSSARLEGETPENRPNEPTPPASLPSPVRYSDGSVSREYEEQSACSEISDVRVKNVLERMNLDRTDIAELLEGATIACNITTLRQAAALIKDLAATREPVSVNLIERIAEQIIKSPCHLGTREDAFILARDVAEELELCRK